MTAKKDEEKQVVSCVTVNPDGSRTVSGPDCSFCGKPYHEVRHTVGGPKGVIICDECVQLASDIMKETFEPKQSEVERRQAEMRQEVLDKMRGLQGEKDVEKAHVQADALLRKYVQEIMCDVEMGEAYGAVPKRM